MIKRAARPAAAKPRDARGRQGLRCGGLRRGPQDPQDHAARRDQRHGVEDRQGAQDRRRWQNYRHEGYGISQRCRKRIEESLRLGQDDRRRCKVSSRARQGERLLHIYSDRLQPHQDTKTAGRSSLTDEKPRHRNVKKSARQARNALEALHKKIKPQDSGQNLSVFQQPASCFHISEQHGWFGSLPRS